MMNIDKTKKYMACRSDKIGLFPENLIFDFHVDVYNNGVKDIQDEFIFTHNGKQYMYNFISLEELKSMLETIKMFKENVVVEIIDYGDKGLRLRYFYLLKEYDILINCEIENIHSYQKTHFEVESTGYKGTCHGNILLEYDEEKRNRLLNLKRLTKKIKKEVVCIREELSLDKQNRVYNVRNNMYGNKDDILFGK